MAASTHRPVPLAEELRVPFWIMLMGVGVGAAWALAGVAVGSWVRSRTIRAKTSS